MQGAIQVTLVAGARPNFVKVAPIANAIDAAAAGGRRISYRLVHTGQHYDDGMSGTFFRELGITRPHVNLGCGGGTQAEQTATIMVAFERDLAEHPVDVVIVVGDVTSTLACSIVAKKLGTRVAHVEAGIRSGDPRMPEEINRIVTDSITDYFFTTSRPACDNLRRCGALPERIFFVGNVMIDTLLANLGRLSRPPAFDRLGLREGGYFVMTLHRPSNVDDPEKLHTLVGAIAEGAQGLPVLFPVHPRTDAHLPGREALAENVHLLPPLGYLEFNYLVRHAKAVLTDSGGITEETTVLGVPCLTFRDSTERPETVTVGTNELLGTDPAAIPAAFARVLSGSWKTGGVPELWDGRAAGRIVDVLLRLFSGEGV